MKTKFAMTATALVLLVAGSFSVSAQEYDSAATTDFGQQTQRETTNSGFNYEINRDNTVTTTTTQLQPTGNTYPYVQGRTTYEGGSPAPGQYNTNRTTNTNSSVTIGVGRHF